MAIINKNGYVERKRKSTKCTNAKATKSSYYFPTWHNETILKIAIKDIVVPHELKGHKIQLRVYVDGQPFTPTLKKK